MIEESATLSVLRRASAVFFVLSAACSVTTEEDPSDAGADAPFAEDTGAPACPACCIGPCTSPIPPGDAIGFPIDASGDLPFFDAGGPQFFADGAEVPDGTTLCVTSIDCPGASVCGYSATAGCEATYGICVGQVSGPSGAPACGCDGNPVQYVAPGYTLVPVASPVACGLDASAYEDATSDDGVTDASDDASTNGTQGGKAADD
jgi:hypothetical protein